MNNPKQPEKAQRQPGQRLRREIPKSRKAEEGNRGASDTGELLEGEGSPGLTVSGGGGHA
jgi:hypothetical protein